MATIKNTKFMWNTEDLHNLETQCDTPFFMSTSMFTSMPIRHRRSNAYRCDPYSVVDVPRRSNAFCNDPKHAIPRRFNAEQQQQQEQQQQRPYRTKPPSIFFSPSPVFNVRQTPVRDTVNDTVKGINISQGMRGVRMLMPPLILAKDYNAVKCACCSLVLKVWQEPYVINLKRPKAKYHVKCYSSDSNDVDVLWPSKKRCSLCASRLVYSEPVWVIFDEDSVKHYLHKNCAMSNSIISEMAI